MAAEEIGKLIVRLSAEIHDLKKGLSEAQSSIAKFSTEAKSSGDRISSSLKSVQESYLFLAAKIYAAYKIVEQGLKFLEIGAKAQQTSEAFENLTRSMGINGQELIRQLQETGKVFVDTTDLMIKAQRLLVEGVDPQDIVKLMESARVASRMMGISVSEAFDRISEAVITLRTRGLRAVFTMDDQKVIEEYARSLGVIPQYLTQIGERQAIVNEILRQTVQKQSLLGTLSDPSTANRLEEFRSTITALIEEISKIFVGFASGSGTIDVLINDFRNLINIIASFQSTAKDLSIIFTPIGIAIRTILIGIGGFFVGVTTIFSALLEINIQFQKVLDIITFGKIPALSKNLEQLREIQERTLKSLQEQAEALNKMMKGQPPVPAAPEKPKTAAPPSPNIRSVQKDVVDYKKYYEDLARFRLNLEEQTSSAIANIKRNRLQMDRVLEITELKKLGQDTTMLELEYERRLADLEYRQTIESLARRRELEIREAVKTGMDVAAVREKFRVLEEEAATKLALSLAEIRSKEALSFESLYGMTEEELRAGIERMRALREMDLDQWIRENNLKKASEAELHAEIVRNRIREEQFQISKEDRIRREIEIYRELLKNAEEYLAIISREDEEWVSAYNEVENYKNKLMELNHELARHTAAMDQLINIGLTQYSHKLRTDLIYSLENLLPNAIDTLGSSFKTLFKDLANGTKSASDAFKDFARNFGESIMDMLIDLALLIAKMEILKALGYGTTGTAGGTAGTTGGWINLIISLLGGLLGFQSGGKIVGPPGIDKVPIRATAGEYIHPVSAVRYYGLDVMEKLRTRKIPKEAIRVLASKTPPPSLLIPSVAMQMGGTVPVLETVEGEKRTEITLINIVDPREMDSWAASSRGQNAILNVISSRAQTVRKILQ